GLMQPVRASSEGIEWPLKFHRSLWLERARNRAPLTTIASPCRSRGSRLQGSAVRVGDFLWRIPGGLAAISAAAPVNFQAGRRLFFPFRKVDARGCAHFFVRTSASASALNLRCDRIVTTTSVFLA